MSMRSSHFYCLDTRDTKVKVLYSVILTSRTSPASECMRMCSIASEGKLNFHEMKNCSRK